MSYKAVRGQACAGSAAVPASWQISKQGDLGPPQPPLHFKWEALGALQKLLSWREPYTQLSPPLGNSRGRPGMGEQAVPLLRRQVRGWVDLRLKLRLPEQETEGSWGELGSSASPGG